jgi:hypothetical protein
MNRILGRWGLQAVVFIVVVPLAASWLWPSVPTWAVVLVAAILWIAAALIVGMRGDRQ